MLPSTRFGIPLNFRQGVAVFSAALGFQIVFMIVIETAIQLGVFGNNNTETLSVLFSPTSTMLQVTITNAALVLLAIIPLRMNHLKFSKTFGFTHPGLFFVVLGALGVLPLGVIVDEIAWGLHTLAPSIFDPRGLDQMAEVFSKSSLGGFILATIAVTIAPAFGEEIMFRGMILRSFRENMSPWVAIVGTSVLFGVIHFNMLQGTGALIIGLYLGFLALASRSIWPAIAAHGVNNFICAISARFAPLSAGKAFSLGHPLWLVIAALITFSVITAILIRASTQSKIQDS